MQEGRTEPARQRGRAGQASGARAIHGGGAKPAIRLRLTHSHASACSAVLPVPLSGIGMGAALQLGAQQVSAAQRCAADLCRIAWRDGPGGWHLHNTGHALACAINGERVDGEWPWPIEVGDVLEFGFLRLVVEADAPSHGKSGLAHRAPLRT